VFLAENLPRLGVEEQGVARLDFLATLGAPVLVGQEVLALRPAGLQPVGGAGELDDPLADLGSLCGVGLLEVDDWNGFERLGYYDYREKGSVRAK
jgi:hypothetical protein